MRINLVGEPSGKAWMLRVCVGLAHIVDGVIIVLTIGCVHPAAALEISRRLAAERQAARGLLDGTSQ